jgi:hypothetical protein
MGQIGEPQRIIETMPAVPAPMPVEPAPAEPVKVPA